MASNKIEDFSAHSTKLWSCHNALERSEVISAITKIQEAASIGRFHLYIPKGDMDIDTVEFLSILGYGVISSNDYNLITWKNIGST